MSQAGGRPGKGELRPGRRTATPSGWSPSSSLPVWRGASEGGVSTAGCDATRLSPAGRASDAAATLTMLHHVSGVDLGDLVLAELARVPRRGGVVARSDSLRGPGFRDLHIDDVRGPLGPATPEQRLLRAGFASADVATLRFDESGSGAIRPRARTGGLTQRDG